MLYPATIDRTVAIQAPAAVVWQYLTVPERMKQWMLGAEMHMDIFTNWQVGSAIRMKGSLHGIWFECWGQVVACEPEKSLAYTQLSSLSQLPEVPESFYTLAFTLVASDTHTRLQLVISHFPTETIFKHLEFYWRVALGELKKRIEQQADIASALPAAP